MKTLEQVRLEVDSRRHTVTALGHAIEKQRAKVVPAGTSTAQKVENQMDQTIRKMQHKENKLAGASLSVQLYLHSIVQHLFHVLGLCALLEQYFMPCLDFVGVLAASRQSFKEQEALVYQQLAQLIRDGVWLKSYLAAVMRLEQEAFQVQRARAC